MVIKLKGQCMRWIVISVVLVGLLGGCSSTLYDWGNYDKSLYRMYRKVDTYNLHEEIDRFSVEIEKTQSKDKLVPPGKLAHLGYLFYLSGDTGSAIQHFEAEKQLFPESSTFMDRMLEQIR